MTLSVTIPRQKSAPLRWVANVVLRNFLEMAIEIHDGDGPDIVIGDGNRTLSLVSTFPDFAGPREDWDALLPALPLSVWHVTRDLPELDCSDLLPILFGIAHVEIEPSKIRCDVDILGSIFFMLSRFEEIVLPDRDEHDRFPATASLAFKADFLHRPIVDEYVEVLWALMQRLWPTLERKRRQGEVRISCDVDQPFDPSVASPGPLLRALAGDILRRRDIGGAAKRVLNFHHQRHGRYHHDPYYVFDWYMDQCERNGHRAAFYFIAGHSGGAIDGNYGVNEPRIVSLIKAISDRGHEIGMHGSYNTLRSPDQIAKERQALSAACDAAGIGSAIAGNRQHYLRWDAGCTPDYLEAGGFEYDSSGSFADRPGFRYGTSHPFSMWSWIKLDSLNLQQRPLVVMEVSLLSKRYLDLSVREAQATFAEFRHSSLKFGGDYSVLWHNSQLDTEDRQALFQNLVS